MRNATHASLLLAAQSCGMACSRKVQLVTGGKQAARQQAVPRKNHRRCRRAKGKQAERACHVVQQEAHGLAAKDKYL